MFDQIESILRPLGICVFGGLVGMIFQWQQQVSLPAIGQAHPEVTIIELQSLVADQLQLEVFGPGRILWAEDKLLEGSGVHKVPLGQLLNGEDLKFRDFYYTGNAKTGKFYPSNSYPARGTAVRDRRFFADKRAAIAAGFIPTKLVK